MIELAGYSCSLGGRPVLRDVSLRADAGSLVAVCGPNGSGKTTLLRALAGLLPGGAPRPTEVAYLPQGARCAWGLTAREVAALGGIPRGGLSGADIEAALDACGVLSLAERRVDQLSGGQARRAMLARVLAGRPSVLLLDEPVADLDPAAMHDVMLLLRRVAAEGALVVAVLHALELAASYADRLVVLQGGRKIADGLPGDALQAAADAFGMKLMPDARPLLQPRQPVGVDAHGAD